MEITKVKINKLDHPKESFSNSKALIVGYASVVFDDAFMVHSIKILIKDNIYSIEMHKQKLKDGSHKDVCHCVDNTFRIKLESKIIGMFDIDAVDKTYKV